MRLVAFGGQESIESLVAGGGHLPSALELLLWGTLDQLPAAGAPAPCRRGNRGLEPASAAANLRLTAAFPAASRKRGPPPSSIS